MGLTRVATFRDVKREAVLVVVSGWRAELSHGDLSTHDTAQAVESEVLRQVSGFNTKFPGVHVHVNRDGSLAVATGEKPKVWPEDAAVGPVEAREA